MALSDEQIDAVQLAYIQEVFRTGSSPRKFARAIEAEVRRQDEALILMLVERLERADKISGYPNNKAAIAAARARLEGKP